MERLKTIIPLYADVLFGDSSVSSKISTFNIEGHASPSFLGEYVDPFEGHPEAYSYNLELSARRSASVAKHIFGKEVGVYNHKFTMRKITQSIGRGYTMPIPRGPSTEALVIVPSLPGSELGRAPASLGSIQDCGPYDCQQSQRVEISFTLEDDAEALEKILQIKNKF